MGLQYTRYGSLEVLRYLVFCCFCNVVIFWWLFIDGFCQINYEKTLVDDFSDAFGFVGLFFMNICKKSLFLHDKHIMYGKDKHSRHSL